MKNLQENIKTRFNFLHLHMLQNDLKSIIPINLKIKVSINTLHTHSTHPLC